MNLRGMKFAIMYVHTVLGPYQINMTKPLHSTRNNATFGRFIVHDR